jgi:hypothetical protein
MRGGGHDIFLGRHLCRLLDRDVGLALVVENNKLIGVFGGGVSIPEPDGKLGGVASTDAERGVASGQWTDEPDFHRVLRFGTCAKRGG